jgi:hypothetical protein
MPTILDLLGIEVPGGLDGRALLGNEEAAAPPVYAETAFPRLHFGWSELYSLIDYPYHFIYGPDPELYDLESDPDERNNLVASERVRASRLREHLDTIDREIGDPSDEDAETRQKLAALGYIGTARGGSSDGPRPDPKSQIHLLERLRGAFTHYENRRFPEAERAFRALLEESPNLVDAWEQLGHSLTAQERFEESLVPFERAMTSTGSASSARCRRTGSWRWRAQRRRADHPCGACTSDRRPCRRSCGAERRPGAACARWSTPTASPRRPTGSAEPPRESSNPRTA